jgi:hypothetical protein
MVFGCSYDVYSDGVFHSRASGHSIFYSEEFSTINSEADILKYLKENYSYERDIWDNWKSPSVMVSDRSGDCEDYCILFSNILYTELNIKSKIILIDSNSEISRSVASGGTINHALVLVGSDLYDPTSGRYLRKIEYFKYKIGYSYSFDEIFTE